MISCSTMNDWDVSKIIDKTERWLFDKKIILMKKKLVLMNLMTKNLLKKKLK